jgi:hypothetical protein
MQEIYSLISVLAIAAGSLFLLYHIFTQATSLFDVMFVLGFGGSIVIIGGMMWPLTIAFVLYVVLTDERDKPQQ